jgi:hypothetical protein
VEEGGGMLLANRFIVVIAHTTAHEMVSIHHGRFDLKLQYFGQQIWLIKSNDCNIVHHSAVMHTHTQM